MPFAIILYHALWFQNKIGPTLNGVLFKPTMRLLLANMAKVCSSRCSRVLRIGGSLSLGGQTFYDVVQQCWSMSGARPQAMIFVGQRHLTKIGVIWPTKNRIK